MKDAYKMLKEIGLHRRFVIQMILRAPFDTLMTILTANMMNSFLLQIEAGDRSGVTAMFFVYLGFSVLLFAYNMTVWMTISVENDVLLQSRLRTEAFEALMELTPAELESEGTGEWMTRLNNDVDTACNYFLQPVNFMHTMIALVSVVISSIIMICMNLPLFAVALVCMLPFFLLNTMVITKDVKKYREAGRKAFARYTGLLEPAVETADVLEVFDGKEFLMEKIEEESLGILRENMKFHRRTALTNLVNSFSGCLGYLLLLAVGNAMIGTTVRDFAALTKFTQYRAYTTKSTFVAGAGISNMRTNIVGIQRIRELQKGHRHGK